jgi:hypothetical protein
MGEFGDFETNHRSTGIGRLRQGTSNGDSSIPSQIRSEPCEHFNCPGTLTPYARRRRRGRGAIALSCFMRLS